MAKELKKATLTKHNIDLCIAVMSSDSYNDIWPAFFDYWFANSLFSSLPIYLITATKSYDDVRVKVINTPESKDLSWSHRLVDGIQQIDHQYILLLTEDLICYAESDLKLINEIYEFIASNDISCLRLVPSPCPDNKIFGNIGLLSDWRLYRVSLQASIWNKTSLLNILKIGETPWQFELFGTVRAKEYSGYFAVYYPVLHYAEIVGRGKLTRLGYKLLLARNIPISREVYSIFGDIERKYHYLKSTIFYRMPVTIQRPLSLRTIDKWTKLQKQSKSK